MLRRSCSTNLFVIVNPTLTLLLFNTQSQASKLSRIHAAELQSLRAEAEKRTFTLGSFNICPTPRFHAAFTYRPASCRGATPLSCRLCLQRRRGNTHLHINVSPTFTLLLSNTPPPRCCYLQASELSRRHAAELQALRAEAEAEAARLKAAHEQEREALRAEAEEAAAQLRAQLRQAQVCMCVGND